MSTDFLEIEHKFLVDPSFDAADFCQRALALGPSRTIAMPTRDTYFLLALQPELIFRHRYDPDRQELTVKSRSGSDTEVRLEVNLRLDPGSGDQLDRVAAFLRPWRIAFQGTLHKDIQVFYYPDCELVYYEAYIAAERLRCVEFEAIGARDVTSASAILASYEERLGFAGRARTPASLFDLLLWPRMNAALERID